MQLLTLRRNHFRALTLASALALTAFARPAAADIIANGGFEGGMTGWTIVNSNNSLGSFYLQYGIYSPVNGDTVVSPAMGSYASMTDGDGPGSHLLWQDFTLNSASSQYLLSFDIFIANRAPQYATPLSGTLDFGIPGLNQQVRVDLMLATTIDAFSVDAADVLLNIYQSSAGDTLISPAYVTITADITNIVNANLGIPLRIRFAETDNVAPLQFGVDNVSITSADPLPPSIPEPGTLLLTAGALAAAAWWRRRSCAA